MLGVWRMADAPKEPLTQVLVELAKLSTKLDNFTKAHDTHANQIEKKADAEDMNRRWAAQSKVNWFIGSTAATAIISLGGILIKQLFGA